MRESSAREDQQGVPKQGERGRDERMREKPKEGENRLQELNQRLF